LTLNDFYVSRDGKEIKIRNLDHFSSFNKNGKIFYGPDLNIILCFYKNYFNFENTLNENSTNKIKILNLNDEKNVKENQSKINNDENKKKKKNYQFKENDARSKLQNQNKDKIPLNNNMIESDYSKSNYNNKSNENNKKSNKTGENPNDDLNLNIHNYDIEKKLHYSNLDFNDYNDPYICPDFIIKDVKELTNKMDTWIFGSLLFHILYGQPPVSFIQQLKEWCDNQTNLIFEKIKFPFNITSKHFFYNPFKRDLTNSFNEYIWNQNNLNNNIEKIDIQNSSTNLQNFKNVKKEINFNNLVNPTKNNKINFSEGCFKKLILENEILIKATKLNSFSATVNDKHLNPQTENRKNINGVGIVLDMIASCLNLEDHQRPDLCTLFKSDLFKFDNYEMILINKFAYNTLRFLSPEAIILKKILLPLRDVFFSINS